MPAAPHGASAQDDARFSAAGVFPLPLLVSLGLLVVCSPFNMA